MAGDPHSQDDSTERYRILGRLGSGGMGEVLRGVHVDLGREVAIKRLKPELSLDQSVLKRFENEARAVNLIRHENIVEVTDFYSDANGQVHMVMELLQGRSLGDLIRKAAPLPIERVAHIGAQIADALDAAHEHGVIHRDLKPENVFLIRRKSSDDYVKLLDFGIARLRPECGGLEATESGLIIGTPVYMSPEQAKGTPADKATDMYSLGVLLYEMIAGHWPFPKTSAVQMMMAHIEQEPQPLNVPGVPEELEDLVAQCLAKDPSTRPQSMGEVARLLETWASPTRFTKSETMEVVRGLSDTYFPGSEATNESTWDNTQQSPRALSEEEETSSRVPSAGIVSIIVAFLVLGAVAGWWLIKTRDVPSAEGVANTSTDAAGSAAAGASATDEDRAVLHRHTEGFGMPDAPDDCQSSDAQTVKTLAHATALLANGAPGGARAEDASALLALKGIESDLSPEVYLWRARAYLQMGDTEEAIRNARLSYGGCKAMAAAYATEGTALALSGNDKDAIETLQVAVDLEGSYVDARFNLAFSQFAEERHTEALGNLTLVIEQEPDVPAAHFLRGQCALLLGDATAAVADLRVAVQKQEDSGNAWYALGYALGELGKRRESRDAYCRAFKLGDTRARCEGISATAEDIQP